MSLGGWLGKTVLKRIESIPAIQEQMARSERTRPVVHAARSAAYGRLDDAAAKAKLREELLRLKIDLEVLKEALDHYNRQDQYIDDRSYRLLQAAVSDAAVEPPPAGRAEFYAQEEELGRMPLESAFRRLAELEPALLELEPQARGLAEESGPDRCGLPERLRRRLGELVGGGARSDHELLRGSLATSIVHQYLEVCAGNGVFPPPDIAYFDSPIKHFVMTGVLFGRRRAGERSR
jgi:hypothetical protein